MNDTSNCAAFKEADDFVMKTYFLVTKTTYTYFCLVEKEESNKKNVSMHFSSRVKKTRA